MKEKTICRGDLFYYDFGTRTGSVQSGTRPVLVIQADDYNRNAPTIIVAAVTGVIKKRYLPSHILLGQEFGLKKPSMVLLEQLQTVNKDELRDYIGTIEDEQLLRRINITLKKTFGLWIYMEEKREFFWQNGYRIRKLNQAYFAFYGSYNDTPGGGAAGDDPVGPAVQQLREESTSLKGFIDKIKLIKSINDLLTELK